MSDSDCTKTITPAEAPRLKEIIAALPEGAVLCLGAGTYPVQLWLERSITVRGVGAVVVDAEGNGPTVMVARAGIDVTIERLTLRRGFGTAGGRGGNLDQGVEARVALRDVRLDSGVSDSNGGGGFLAHAGTLLLERCRIERNSGKKATAVLIDGSAKVTLRDCLIVGNSGTKPAMAPPAVLVDAAGELVVEHSTVLQDGGPALRVHGWSAVAPRVTINSCVLGEVTVEAPGPDPKIVVRQTAMSHGPTGIDDGGGNLIGEFSVDANGRPAPHSPAAGRGPR